MKLTVPFLAFILLLNACERQQSRGASPTASAASRLPGVWVSHVVLPGGGLMDDVLTIGRDGSYTCALTVHTRSNGLRNVELQGFLRVESAFLIDTVTNNSQTNAPVPATDRAHIIRIDDKEMVLAYEDQPGVVRTTNRIVYRRQTK